MTAAGAKLWKALPDVALIHDVAFKGMDAADIAAAVRVLQTATERLETYIETSGSPLKLRHMGNVAGVSRKRKSLAGSQGPFSTLAGEGG